MHKQAEHEQLLDYTEACRRLHCSRTTLWAFVRDGKTPEPIRLGRARRFRAVEIDKLVHRLAEQAAGARAGKDTAGATDGADTAEHGGEPSRAVTGA